MPAELDVVYVLDARFEGGVSTAVAAELAHLVGYANLRIGILLVKAHLLNLPWPLHPAIRSHLAAGRISLLRPGEDWHCQLALIHHPVVFANMPRSPLPLRADRAILVLHHPMRDATGGLQYDLARIAGHIRDALCPDLLIAPVSKVVRDSLGAFRHVGDAAGTGIWAGPAAGVGTVGEVTAEDWQNLLDLGDWPFDPERSPPPPDRIVIGRHARPDPQKWPDTRTEAEQVYLAGAPGVEVRILGGGPFLEALYGPDLPGNWAIEPFSFAPMQAFLGGLDAYVYFHSSAWSEAFGRNVMEALAVGLVTILPPTFAPIYGDAALYCTPAEVGPTLDALRADPAAWQAQRRRARLWVVRNCALGIARERLNLYGWRETRAAEAGDRPEPPALPALAGRRPRPILFLSTNGVGVGHLTQQMAIAERLPDALQPVFASMCLSLHVAAARGHPVFYLPHHRHLQVEPDRWNAALAEVVFDLIRHLQPAMLAYDGTAVFDGLARALGEFPDLISLWVRRAMWRECHRPFLQLAPAFTTVVEPGELAVEFDHGPTREMREQVHVVPPVLHIDPAARLDRAAARAHYGLDPGDLAVALQLGSGTDPEVAALRARLLGALLADPRVVVLEIVSPLAPMPETAAGPRLRSFREYPSFPYSRAIDAAVGVAGYNAFHEQLLGGIPTLFVPNEAPEMDSQLTRAHWAELRGLALCLRARHGIGTLAGKVAQLLDDSFRSECRARLAALPPADGAQQLAEFVTDYSAMIRTDRWPQESYPR